MFKLEEARSAHTAAKADLQQKQSSWRLAVTVVGKLQSLVQQRDEKFGTDLVLGRGSAMANWDQAVEAEDALRQATAERDRRERLLHESADNLSAAWHKLQCLLAPSA